MICFGEKNNNEGRAQPRRASLHAPEPQPGRRGGLGVRLLAASGGVGHVGEFFFY